MKLIRLILRRPTSVILMILAVVVFGSASLTGMPLEYMPDMEMPMELVMVTWPGADADSIDRLVTQPIEDECETLSDIIQVTYFKLTHGKRIFKMAPLHHHFEMCGWKETKVVAVFAAVSTIFCVLAYLGVMDRFGA